MRPLLVLMNRRPTLDLDFTTGTLDHRVTYTGGANRTRINSAGTIVAATCPRFDHNPTSLTARGVLCELLRTNMLLNSLIDGTNLATQSVTVTNVAHTLSFYGTGTVTLSGTSTAGPLVGSGAYPTKSTLTFTPTAGSLTLTVSGDVKFSQLEIGAFASSFIPTGGAAVTGSGDSLVISGASFTSWYRPSGVFLVEFSKNNNAVGGRVFTLSDGTSNNQIRLNASLSTNIRPDWQVIVGGAVQANITDSTEIAVDALGKVASAYALNDFRQVCNGIQASADTAGTIPDVNQIAIGANEGAAAQLSGHIKRLRFWPGLPTGRMIALTA